MPMDRYPKFTGKVSLFCHSLGSVIAFDLLWNQKKVRGVEISDDVSPLPPETQSLLPPQSILSS